MARQVSASNAVTQAVEYAAALYGVRSYRMQSRMVRVAGAGGIERPMFMGAWKDQYGETHYKGMADLLLTPRIHTGTYESWHPPGSPPVPFRPCVALWVECKAGTGRLKPEQLLFRDDVLAGGAHWLQARDCADAVIEWFEEHGVKR